MSPLNPELLAILVCPRCGQAVEATADQTWLVCAACEVRYPVQDDIPIMLAEEARALDA